jgi:hypothetical protein
LLEGGYGSVYNEFSSDIYNCDIQEIAMSINNIELNDDEKANYGSLFEQVYFKKYSEVLPARI